jgi:hypothetical protein
MLRELVDYLRVSVYQSKEPYRDQLTYKCQITIVSDNEKSIITSTPAVNLVMIWNKVV